MCPHALFSQAQSQMVNVETTGWIFDRFDEKHDV